MGRKYKNQRKKANEKKIAHEAANPNEKKIKPNPPPYLDLVQKVKKNCYFRNYYKLVLKECFQDANEFSYFMDILIQKLPMTFRVNPTTPNYQSFIKKLMDPKIITDFCQEKIDQKENNQTEDLSQDITSKRKKEYTDEGTIQFKFLDIELKNSLQFVCNPWYSDNLVWTLNIDKYKFKKSKIFDNLHKFLSQAAEAGLITRQEIVSMLPPLFLDVQNDDMILDMCAAPGSKTSQILEMMQQNYYLKKQIKYQIQDYKFFNHNMHSLNLIYQIYDYYQGIKMSQKEKLQKLKGNNVKYLISLNLILPYEKKFFNDIEILTDQTILLLNKQNIIQIKYFFGKYKQKNIITFVLICYDYDKNIFNRGVVANDCDLSRASLLIHQIQRINTAGMLVLNHSGQFLPTIYQDKEGQKGPIKIDDKNFKSSPKFFYDKVLADVPCSGDGAIRKLPVKWDTWHSNDGFGLFHLQTQLLQRALQLVKVGGLVLYSTCSINPIEDEAVVTEMFRKVENDCFELLDISDKLQGLKTRRGLLSWPILNMKWDIKEKYKKDSECEDPYELFNVYNNYEEFQAKYQDGHKTSVCPGNFPSDEKTMRDVYKIQNTIRIMPQDQDSGGFYLALFRKKKELVLIKKEESVIQDSDVQNDNQELKKNNIEQKMNNLESDQCQKTNLIDEKQLDNKKNNQKQAFEAKKQKQETRAAEFQPISLEDFNEINEFYEFSEQIGQDDLLVQQKGDKKILLVSEYIKKLIKFDSSYQMNKVNLGAKAFYKQNCKFSGAKVCSYRLCQDSVLAILPFIKKRKIKCDFNQFIAILQNGISQSHDSLDNSLKKAFKDVGPGSTTIYFDEYVDTLGYRIKDALVFNNFHQSFNLMIAKENLDSLRIRYL